MNENELITKQQLEIEDLKEQIKLYAKGHDDVYNILYSIGAPLNDNKLHYTKAQMLDFIKIRIALNL